MSPVERLEVLFGELAELTGQRNAIDGRIVEIVAEVKAPVAMPAAVNHIEIELAGGHRMRLIGGYDPEALARLIRGLTA